MSKNKGISKVVYSTIAGDLFHYGHLRALKFAKSLGDLHVCGVLTDEVIKSYRRKPISNLEERKAVIENLKIIDKVIVQDKKNSTEILKEIHREFPDAEIILVRGEDWNYFPELEYLKSINGRIAIHPYYKRLSDFKIVSGLLESYRGKFRDFKEFTYYFGMKDFEKGILKEETRPIISTKANTLKALHPLLKHAKIEESYIFKTSDWEERRDQILSRIQQKFNSSRIVVRSSAINEDTLKTSMAGYFHSELNIDSTDRLKLEKAINNVIDSYSVKDAASLLNQVLIQRQTENIKLSGVVFTTVLENGAPYYVINYDDKSGLSDTVTKGIENKSIKIAKSADPKNYAEKFHKLITAVNEIETIIPDLTLDIEFAININNEVVIFQVRPVTLDISQDDFLDEEIKSRIESLKQDLFKLNKGSDHLFGDESCFADMPDWNPAEIIGDSPNYLAYSLYCYIITDSVWHEARSSQGYRNVAPAKLVILFGNKPYVDVRSSFNSFIPGSIPDYLAEKLVKFYLNKLKNNPELQDKVEFDVLYTCYDFSFDERSRELVDAKFSNDEIEEIKQALLGLTNNFFENYKEMIEKDLSSVNTMSGVREHVKGLIIKSELSAGELIQQAKILLGSCKGGTLQFSRLARLAFVGKIILKSMVDKKIIDNELYDSYLKSVSTVATDMSKDFNILNNGKMSKEKFLRKYGHLRPGTYDITNLRYDSNPRLLSRLDSHEVEKGTKFIISKEIHDRVSETLKEHRLNIDSEVFFDFIKKTLEARELSKFEFTKNLSDAIELIANAGEKMALSRSDLSYLDVNNILRLVDDEDFEEVQKNWLSLIEFRKKERDIYKKIILPPIIFSEKDFEVIYDYVSKPNFITRKKVSADVVDIDKFKKDDIPDLGGKIILLENGDPGYDWIFTKNPAGLITKYGGVASHMSIRCAEFGLAAAIGCGSLFDSIKNSSSVLLDCEGNKISSVGGT